MEERGKQLDYRSRKILLASVAIIGVLVFLGTVQGGLSSPVLVPVVVKMDNSPGVNISVDTVKENNPNSVVVDYNSLAYLFIIGRAYGGVVWVGHGSQEGVQTQQGMETWQALAAKVEVAPSKDIILACYSAEILNYAPKAQVPVTFNGMMQNSAP